MDRLLPPPTTNHSHYRLRQASSSKLSGQFWGPSTSNKSFQIIKRFQWYCHWTWQHATHNTWENLSTLLRWLRKSSQLTTIHLLFNQKLAQFILWQKCKLCHKDVKAIYTLSRLPWKCLKLFRVLLRMANRHNEKGLSVFMHLCQAERVFNSEDYTHKRVKSTFNMCTRQ